MKQRIVNALIYFAGLGGTENFESLRSDVAEQTQLSKTEIQQKSLNILKFLIPNYASFEVSTIDRFNHRIIRTFARDLKIDQNFEIDLDSAPYIQKAIDDLIEDVGENEELTSWLIEFVKYKVNNNKSGDIHKDLTAYAELILNENNYQALEEVQKLDLKDFKKIKHQIIHHQKSTYKSLRQLAEDFFRLLNENNIDSVCFPRQSIPKYFSGILEEKIEDQFKNQWHNSIETTSFCSRKYEKDFADRLEAIRPTIEQLFLESKTKSLAYHLADRVLKNFVPLAMISEVQKRLNTLKKEESILFINDFNRIISQQIIQQPAPFIYERLGEKFRHYFIDEFQDTSQLQWQNLQPLVDNAITTQHEDGTSGHLYLVGDVKQSIYEWRGGDPQQFLDLSQGNIQPFSIVSERKTLENNWRSAKEIVHFNNDFFEFAAQKLTNPKHQELFAKATQKHQKSNDGFVNIRFLEDLKDKQERLDNRIVNLQNIITDLQDNGYALSDICILVRKNKQGSAIAEAFNALDKPIPVVSQESLLIISDVKVKLAVKFLHFMHHFNQQTCVDFTLDWLLYTSEYSENLTEKLIQIKKLKLKEALAFLKPCGISADIELYRQFSIYDKAEYIIRQLGFAVKANVYLQFFLDEIFDYATTKSSSMRDFLAYWEEVKDKRSITTSEDTEAVNIMTIHKSKGLEFPVVIYAQANFVLADLGQTKDWIPLDKTTYGIPYFYSSISESISLLSKETETAYLKNLSQQELSNMNNAYVALTRAEEQLYILCEPITTSRKYKFEDLLKDFLKSKNLFDEDQQSFTFGNLIIKERPSNKLTVMSSGFDSYATYDYYAGLTPEKTLENQFTSQQVYGQEVHDLLQKIVYRDDLAKINAEKETLAKLADIINDENLSVFFGKDWTIYNEKDLVFDGQILRPDRVCIKADEAVIIDYKTGVERDVHQQQLISYKAALEAMGFTIISTFLVYIRKNIYIKTV